MLLSEVTPDTLEPRVLRGEFDVALSYQDATSERREIPGIPVRCAARGVVVT